LSAFPAGAIVVSITQSDLPGGDVLLIPSNMVADELGDEDFGFPEGERITHSTVSTTITVCDNMVDNPTIPNRRITISNLQPYSIYGLCYVVNGLVTPGSFSNYDGSVNGAWAMMIDSVGFNRPLIFESMTADGVFEAGETWQFVVQDYVSGTGSANFVTPGQVGSGDTQPSIIVPEPGALGLGLLGGLLWLHRRRS
jgi:MYXO-CTERM domain-containing protein